MQSTQSEQLTRTSQCLFFSIIVYPNSTENESALSNFEWYGSTNAQYTWYKTLELGISKENDLNIVHIVFWEREGDE